MAGNDYKQIHLSRRKFIELTGSGAVLMGIGSGGVADNGAMLSSMQGMRGDKPAQPKPGTRLLRSTHLEAEVVVVGGGELPVARWI